MKRISTIIVINFLVLIFFVSSGLAQEYPYLRGFLLNPNDYTQAATTGATVTIYCSGESNARGAVTSDNNGYWVYPPIINNTQAPLSPCSTFFYISSTRGTFRWSTNNSGIYNVKDFGAQGNGNDDANAIQYAVYYIANQNGGKLYFPPGDYVTSKGFVLPKGISIEGINGTSTSNSRLTLSATTTTAYLFKIGERTDGVSFKSILLSTSSLLLTTPTYLAGSKAIYATGSAANPESQSVGLAFRDMTIQGFEKGIHVYGSDSSWAWLLETVRLDHVKLFGNKTSIEIDTHNTDWQISNSLIGAVKDGIGLDIKHAGAILIENSFGWGAGPSTEIGTSNVSETFINISGPHSVIKIDNTQCEKFRNFMVVDQRNSEGNRYPDYLNPIMLANSVVGDRIIFKSNVMFVSTANSYLSDSVQAWTAGQPLKFNDGTAYTTQNIRNFSDSTCQNITDNTSTCCPVSNVSTPTDGAANNVKIYSTGDSFSHYNRYYCAIPNAPSDFVVSGTTTVYGGGKSKITFEGNVGVGSLNPGNGYDPSIYRVLEVEGKDGRAPALFLNRTGGTTGNRRWAWMVWQDGNLYLQEVGVANRLVIDANGNLLPAADNTGQIGADGQRWAKVRANVIQPGDIILTDITTGKELYRIKEDEDNIYFSDIRTGKEMMRLDRNGNLYVKGKIYQDGETTQKKKTSPKSNKAIKKSRRVKRGGR